MSRTMNFINNSDSDLFVEGWVTCMYGLDSAKLIKVRAGESQLIPKSNTDCWTIYDSKFFKRDRICCSISTFNKS